VRPGAGPATRAAFAFRGTRASPSGATPAGVTAVLELLWRRPLRLRGRPNCDCGCSTAGLKERREETRDPETAEVETRVWKEAAGLDAEPVTRRMMRVRGATEAIVRQRFQLGDCFQLG
jgi:hypothetical protein